MIASTLLTAIVPQSVRADQVLNQSFPIGIIIRQSILSKLVELVNQSAQPFKLTTCIDSLPQVGRWTIDISYSLQLSGSDWVAMKSQAINLRSSVSQFYAEGTLYQGCVFEQKDTQLAPELIIDPKNEFAKFRVRQATPEAVIPVSVWFDPNSFTTKAEATSIDNISRAFTLEIDQLENLSFALNRDAMKAALLTWVAELGGHAFGTWLQARLRGLSYVEDLGQLISQAQNRKEWIHFQKGPFTVEHNPKHLEQLRLAFAVFPRRDRALQIRSSALEFYFNSLLFNSEDLAQIKNGAPQSFSDHVLDFRQWLSSDAADLDAKFQTPPLIPSASDFTMFLSEDLVNHSLDKTYREDLFSFRTSVDLGDSTKGLLAKEVADVRLRLDLGSRKAPRLRFEADRLNLHVTDYVLSLGVEIEDRIIPSTHIQTTVDLAANLAFDPKSQSINLVMESESFQIQLEELHGKRQKRLLPEDLELLEGIAENFWKTYFTAQPQLALFRPVFEAENAEIEGLQPSVRDGMILMDFNLKSKKPPRNERKP